MLEEVVGNTSVLLTTNNPDTGERAVRKAETNLGDFCADAFRDQSGDVYKRKGVHDAGEIKNTAAVKQAYAMGKNI